MFMEIFEGLFQEVKGFGGMKWVLSKVQKVKKRADGANEGQWGSSVREF